MATRMHQRPADRFAAIMATLYGRGLRMVAGLILLGLGGLVIRQPYGAIVALIGLAPIAAGLLNWCLIAPLIGAPLHGDDVR